MLSFPDLFVEIKSYLPTLLIGSFIGWVGGANHKVETWLAPPGILLRVEGGSDFYVAPEGLSITKVDGTQEKLREESGLISPFLLSPLDLEIFLGPAFVLALALRGIWSLHASSAMFRNQAIAFLGESGQGKSTLAAYLNSSGWQRVADDILPATFDEMGLLAWPRFPQLKLPMDQQPGFNFPESLPLDQVCLLATAEVDAEPELQRLPPNQAVRVLLSHTAGTRLFPPDLLAEHLEFSARAAEQVPVYQLSYPHRRDVLPKVKGLLESIC